MRMEKKPIKKLYYSISEVSQLTSLKQYVLRYWETEFPELRPTKNRAGNRIYRPKDIKLVFLIKKLLYEDRYTIEGARQKLKSLKLDDSNLQSKELRSSWKNQIAISEIKRDLQDLLEMLR